MSHVSKDVFQNAYYGEAFQQDARYAEYQADFDLLAADNSLEFKELTAILNSDAPYDKKRVAYEIIVACFPEEAKAVAKPQPGLWDDACTYASSVASSLAAPFTSSWNNAAAKYDASPQGWTDVIGAPVEFIDKAEDSFNSLSQVSAYVFDSLATTPSDDVMKNHFEASDRLDVDYAAALALRSGSQIVGGLVGGVASLADTVIYAGLVIPEGAGNLASQVIFSDTTSANDLLEAVTTETHGWAGASGMIGFVDNLLELSPLNFIAPIRGAYRTFVQDDAIDAAFDKLVDTDLTIGSETEFHTAYAASSDFVAALFGKMDANYQRGFIDTFKAMAGNTWDAAWEKSSASMEDGGALAELTAYDSKDEDWISRGARTISMLITYIIPFTKGGKAKMRAVHETIAKPFKPAAPKLPAAPEIAAGTEAPKAGTETAARDAATKDAPPVDGEPVADPFPIEEPAARVVPEEFPLEEPASRVAPDEFPVDDAPADLTTVDEFPLEEPASRVMPEEFPLLDDITENTIPGEPKRVATPSTPEPAAPALPPELRTAKTATPLPAPEILEPAKEIPFEPIRTARVAEAPKGPQVKTSVASEAHRGNPAADPMERQVNTVEGKSAKAVGQSSYGGEGSKYNLINEDGIAMGTRADGSTVAVVFDGAGGAGIGGYPATVIAIEAISREAIANGKPLAEAVKIADQAIFDQHSAQTYGTVAGVEVSPDLQIKVVGVGDARAVTVRSGQVFEPGCTKVHNQVQAMVDSGYIAPEKYYTHPDNNVILKSIGHGPDQFGISAPEAFQGMPGDLVVLASDGVYDIVTPYEIAELSKTHTTANGLQHAIFDLAYERNQTSGPYQIQFSPDTTIEMAPRGYIEYVENGVKKSYKGGDNISVIVVEVGSPTPPIPSSKPTAVPPPPKPMAPAPKPTRPAAPVYEAARATPPLPARPISVDIPDGTSFNYYVEIAAPDGAQTKLVLKYDNASQQLVIDFNKLQQPRGVSWGAIKTKITNGLPSETHTINVKWKGKTYEFNYVDLGIDFCFQFNGVVR